MSKSSGTGASGTEQSGRVRTGGGGAVVPSSGTRFSNYDDILNLPKVTFDNNSLKVLKNLKKDFNLEDISNEEVAAMFGALNNSKIKIIKQREKEYSVQISNDFLDSHDSVIYKDSSGRTKIDLDLFFLKRGNFTNSDGETEFGVLPQYQGKGIGTKSLSRQAFYAAKNGVKYISAYAAEGDGMIGYYVWPKLGFDGPLTSYMKRFAQRHFKDNNINTILDIFDKPDGDSFWYDYGNSNSVIFNLSPKSRSNKRLKSENIKLKNKFGRIW